MQKIQQKKTLLYRHKCNYWLITLVSISATTPNTDPVAVDAMNSESTQTKGPNSENKARYDNYRLYIVKFSNDEHLRAFKQLEKDSSFIFMAAVHEVEQKIPILVAPHRVPCFADLLCTKHVEHKVLGNKLQEKIDQNYTEVIPVGIDVKTEFNWKHFFHLETIYEWLVHMAVQYYNSIVIQDMGTSIENVPIKGVRINSRKPNKATIFIAGGIHSYAWDGPAAATYLIQKLMTSKDRAIKKLTDEYTWIIFPCINPDGYKYTFDYNRMWRKNREIFHIWHGVDLNRNFPDNWKSTDRGAYHFDFEGPKKGSEFETQRVMTYIMEHLDEDKIKVYISLDSSTETLAFPFGHTKEHVANYADLAALASRACAHIRKVSGRPYRHGCFSEIFVNAKSGYSTDWAYEEAKIPIVYTFGLRKPENDEDLFITPASELESTAEEAFAAIQSIVEGANEKGYFN